MRLRSGSEYTREYLDEDIKNLYASGKISDVVAKVENLANGNVSIILQVKPAPIISVMKIEGNAKFETKDLQKHFTINEGERLNSRQLNETLENLRKFYVSKGYSDVRIAPPVIIPDGKNGVIVTTDQLITHIWGWDTSVDTSVVWVHISNIRKKIDALGAPVAIKFVRNVGYVLEETV